MTPYETTAYFTEQPASTLTTADWYALELWLAAGERVPVHYTVWCELLETMPIQSASRAGVIVAFRGMLVRLSPASNGCWLEAIPISPLVEEEPDHEHSIIHVELSDGWEVLRCARCGGEW